MGFTASTTQAFQYSLPYEQVFNAATSALQAVKKATPDRRGHERPLHDVRDALQLHLLR